MVYAVALEMFVAVVVQPASAGTADIAESRPDAMGISCRATKRPGQRCLRVLAADGKLFSIPVQRFILAQEKRAV